MMDRLLCACTPPFHITAPSITLSAALALIETLEPENEVQGAVAVQIACIDAASGNMLTRLGRTIGPSSTTERTNDIAKLERAFTSLLTTYQRLKYGNRQVIRIEKVVVEAGAQAVVGQVVAAP